ncbi:hypothetical protein D3C80_1728020 [compost metagenome]
MTNSKTAPKIPRSLPSANPAATPKVTGANIASRPNPEKLTPAFAKPNIGTMKNATGLIRLCSSRCKGLSEMLASGFAGVRVIGMVNASKTPAIVA